MLHASQEGKEDFILGGDLHCHTRLSDGSLGIEDLILLAQRLKIDTIAITDHDCLAGTVRGKVIGERHGVRVIPGVEFSCMDPQRDNRRAHLLCYLSDSPDRLEGLCRRNSLSRRRAGQYMILKVAKRYPITPEFVLKCASGSTNIFKQHIAHALMECGYTSTIFGELYQELFSSKSPHCVSVEPAFPDIREVLEAVHEAGGIAVLAHPAFYDSFDLLDELITLGLDGVEVWHPTANEETVARLKRTAQKNSLLMTGGSDFHGMYNSRLTRLGACLTPDEQIAELLNYKAKLRRQQKKTAAASDTAV